MRFPLDAQKEKRLPPAHRKNGSKYLDNPAINPQVLLINRGVSDKFELKVYRGSPISRRI